MVEDPYAGRNEYDSESNTNYLDLIVHLQRELRERVHPLLGSLTRVALVDFPDYGNVGDSAIWLGQLALLEALGISKLTYTCALNIYDRKMLARRSSGGAIVLSGGGSLGDVWEPHHRLREQLIAEFPNTPIVQFPQTAHFRSREVLARTRSIFDSHRNLTVLARDQRSFDMLREEFRTRSVLCPDMAFAIGPLARPNEPTVPVTWLSRTDKERRWTPDPEGRDDTVIDWLDEPLTWRRRFSGRLSRQLMRRPWLEPLLREAVSRTYPGLARQRLARGLRILSTGRFVVTDRLHGHILCLLLGIPHALLDNSYGKVSEFYRTWTSGCGLGRLAESPDEAAAMASQQVHMND